ncbi:Putative Mn2+ efflux pump MntP [Agreia bicolorata]|uniref:Putative manganese efflux pump MntP n=1 Tax=Agreia bicolorata TaxID=110935 RepID=A0A1T4XUW5_9MICO|nr:manganese efflux pump MntP family protein [Agreia bicolorata]KJC64041.1 membrane protein [Agreia bicolorata]SKA93193.1 Putative Mn2+ efflux pump MntP [Agreia bicolorata]
MALWSIFFVALGVSADAFAVALGKGLHMRRFNLRNALIIATAFGLFQAIMPVIGWFLGTQFASYITGIDHWIAFVLLALIGGKMLWEAFSNPDDKEVDDRLKIRELLVLSVATSIDALAVGLSFAFLAISITETAVLIGVTTFVLTFAGIVIGHRAGLKFRRPAEIAGGLILILIGARILLEHLGVF